MAALAAFSLAFAILAVFSSTLLMEFTKVLPQPYMDEVFHIPQAQNYCHGNYFFWNDKITTLPGLYFFSQFFLKLFSSIQNLDVADICSVLELRFTNAIFIMFAFIFVYLIIDNESKNIETDNKETKNGSSLWVAATAFVIVQFPLLYFFTFLYYTDVGSTLFVLIAYYASMKSRHMLAALAGVLAILFRQTNIVWVGFCCFTAILDNLKRTGVVKKEDPLYLQIYNTVTGCFKSIVSTLSIAFPYVTVLLGFVCFVVVNNGIVVGDRSSHEASLNFPQILYFSIFTITFSCFIALNYLNVVSTFKTTCNVLTSFGNAASVLILTTAMFLAVHYFTYQHLYLISDNRHFTFYIWRRVFGYHPHVKYFLVPVYLISVLVMTKELSFKRSGIWILVFFACTGIVLIPQKLLEFRYFIIPYLLFRLNLRTSSLLQLFTEGLVYTLVNFTTMWIFLRRTHTQNGLSGQRIMW